MLFRGPGSGRKLGDALDGAIVEAVRNGGEIFSERYANHISSGAAGESTFMGCQLSYLHPQAIRLAPRFSWKSTSPKG